ncbi:Zona pellucida sperm-binding protein 3, partial [Dissostichus eleginoides]
MKTSLACILIFIQLFEEDWTGETLTTVFYTGDSLRLEGSYSGPVAGHRRLFIDGCVAALSPDPRSAPTYYFIENHGCFNDGKEDGSNALFNPRTRSSSLQLQLDAFLFPQDTRNSICITCQLKATSEMQKSSPTNKACNYKIQEDWTGETLTTVFYTGDSLRLEGSYSGPVAGHRRLFIDGCVAALSPDPRSAPTYYFIENHGCFNDGKEDGSNALFNPRTRSSSLQLQLDAFLFPQDTRNSICITCQLKATSEMQKSSPTNKACNYINSSQINVTVMLTSTFGLKQYT